MPARGRTCVGCRRLRARAELVRLVRTPAGDVRLDPRGRDPGRGAWVCPDPACLRRARRRLAGALRAEQLDFSGIERELTALVEAASGDLR